MPPQFRFPPEEKIRLDRDVQAILREGRRFSEGAWTLVCSQRPSGSPHPPALRRMGVRMGRGFPSAVARNRARRMIREVFRREKERLLPGADLLVLIRPSPEKKVLSFATARAAFVSLSRKAGIWIGE